MSGKLAIVVPCYQEEEVLEETSSQLTAVLESLITEQAVSPDSFILFVNDGSTDNTWPIIRKLHDSNKYVCGVNLAGNVGHQNALVAGLSFAVEHSDMTITIDADLQDDINAIREMVKCFNDGKDIVYGVRQNRDSDTWFKRTSAQGYYRMMKFMGVNLVYNHADFRLMSKRALLHLLSFRERNLFLRGMVPTIGYDTSIVYYDRAERFAGESKYPLRKMMTLAFDGITSFSTKPVHLVLYVGVISMFVAFVILCWTLYTWLFKETVPGWASIMISFWFCSGSVLTGLGIVGEYVGKIYIEVKDRPRYNIESILTHEQEN